VKGLGIFPRGFSQELAVQHNSEVLETQKGSTDFEYRVSWFEVRRIGLVARLPFNLHCRTTVAKACSANRLQTALSALRPIHKERATSAPQIGPYVMLQRPLVPGPECPFEPPDRTVR
jgi:hypothetical protein